MMPVSKLAFGGAALWSLILVAATERDPPAYVAAGEMLAKVAPPPILVPVVGTEPVIPAELTQARDRLRAAMAPARPALTNSEFVADQQPPARSAANGPPPAPPPVADTDADDLRPSQIRVRSASARQAGVNICIRHGMQKVISNGGRSWRCRKNGMNKKPRMPRARKPRTAEQRKRALMRQATSAASDKTNIVGAMKARGRKPRTPTMPHADELSKIRIEGDEEGGGK
jgi:hypothetical protein